MRWSVLLAFLFTACGGECERCPQNFFADVAVYKVSPDKATPSGILVDSGGFAIDLEELDQRVDRIEACLGRVAAEVASAPAEERAKWQCLRDPAEGMPRGCLTVKVVPPVLSKCSSWQFIGVPAPDALCEAKGVHPTAECPCMWRSAVFADRVLITPPAMFVWDIGRILTSCNNIWYSPFAACLG